MREMRRLWQDYHLPYFSPYGWAVIFAGGFLMELEGRDLADLITGDR